MPRRGSIGSSGVKRSAIEKDRRLYTKQLFSRLAFLLPPPGLKRSLMELLDQATAHVKQMGERVEMLMKQKKQLIRTGSCSSTALTVSEVDSMLEVCLKTSSGSSTQRFTLHRVIQVLEEEAAQVVAVSYSNVGGRIFCTIKAQAVSPRIGIETSTVQAKLKEPVF